MKTYLDGAELINHVRAAFDNDRELNELGQLAAIRSENTLILGAFIGMNYEHVSEKVREIWPWLGFTEADFIGAVAQVAREYAEEE